MAVACGYLFLSAMTRSTSERRRSRFFTPTLYLFDVLHLDDMADVGGGKSVNLPDLFHGVITLVVHKVGSAEFVQMGLGVIGAAVFSFGRYPVPVGVCPECGPASCRTALRFFGQEPVGNTVHINCHTEELVNMLPCCNSSFLRCGRWGCGCVWRWYRAMTA